MPAPAPAAAPAPLVHAACLKEPLYIATCCGMLGLRVLRWRRQCRVELVSGKRGCRSATAGDHQGSTKKQLRPSKEEGTTGSSGRERRGTSHMSTRGGHEGGLVS